MLMIIILLGTGYVLYRLISPDQEADEIETELRRADDGEDLFSAASAGDWKAKGDSGDD